MEQALTQREDTLKRIVIFGPESTGKTTLAKELAAHYKTSWAPEYMREYFTKIAPRDPFESYLSDILPIAKGQLENENKAAAAAVDLFFCDTNLLEIKVYSEYYFGSCPSEVSKAVELHKYDFYLLTYPDIPWEKDQIRDRPLGRLKLFAIFEQALQDRNLPYVVLKGSPEQRLAKAQLSIKEIDK